MYGIFHNTSGEGAQWQLYSVDVATGVKKMLAPVDLPASTHSIVGFHVHPTASAFSLPLPSGPTIFGCLRASISRAPKPGPNGCCG